MQRLVGCVDDNEKNQNSISVECQNNVISCVIQMRDNADGDMGVH